MSSPQAVTRTVKALKLRDTRTEKQVEHAGDKAMETLGFVVVRFSQARATMQSPGIPDRRYYNPMLKLALWWEAKRDGGRQSSAQETFMHVARACGEHYVCGTDNDLASCVVPLIQQARKQNV